MSTADGYLIGYELALRTVERLAGGDRDRVWSSMVYACIGRQRGDDYDLPPCGHAERYWLGVGVEGPRNVREIVGRVVRGLPERFELGDDRFWLALRDELYDVGGTIPASFSAGRCPRCHGGAMQHSRFDLDEDFDPVGDVYAYAPEGARFFRVPDLARARYSARFEGYGGAELVSA